MGGTLWASTVQASPKDGLDAYYENEKGIHAFEGGDIEEAKKHFGAAQALQPDSADLLFNQGVIHLEQEDLAAAIDRFDKVVEKAKKENRPELEERALFNLGSSFAKKGDIPSAVRSFLEGIDVAKAHQDPEMEKQLRQKLQSIVQQQKQQQQKQQQQKSDKNKSGGQGQDSEEQKEGQENQENEGQQGNENQDQNQNQKDKDGAGEDQKDLPQSVTNRPRGKQFQSKDLNVDDAERIMEELSSRERELSMKKKAQEGPRGRNAKDW